MVTEVNPPLNDRLIERHQFYATIVGHVNRNIKDINGIGTKIKTYSDDFDLVRDEVRASGTRNKTIVSAAIVIWSIIGSGVGLYITRALSTFDSIVVKIDNIERKMLTIDVFLDRNKDTYEKIESIKKNLNDIQRKTE